MGPLPCKVTQRCVICQLVFLLFFFLTRYHRIKIALWSAYMKEGAQERKGSER